MTKHLGLLSLRRGINSDLGNLATGLQSIFGNWMLKKFQIMQIATFIRNYLGKAYPPFQAEEVKWIAYFGWYSRSLMHWFISAMLSLNITLESKYSSPWCCKDNDESTNNTKTNLWATCNNTMQNNSQFYSTLKLLCTSY